MKRLLVLFAVSINLLMISPLSQAARWWNPDDNDYSGGGMDLDSYRTFTDNEGYEVTSMWVRSHLDKAESLYNPNLNKTSITSGFSMLVQVRCDTSEVKMSEFIFQDRQFNDLWRLSQYPDLADNLKTPFNEFYYPSPSSSEAKMAKSLCSLKNFEEEQGFSIQDLQLDEDGHMVGIDGFEDN